MSSGGWGWPRAFGSLSIESAVILISAIATAACSVAAIRRDENGWPFALLPLIVAVLFGGGALFFLALYAMALVRGG
jgi:hypothetical protein